MKRFALLAAFGLVVASCSSGANEADLQACSTATDTIGGAARVARHGNNPADIYTDGAKQLQVRLPRVGNKDIRKAAQEASSHAAVWTADELSSVAKDWAALKKACDAVDWPNV